LKGLVFVVEKTRRKLSLKLKEEIVDITGVDGVERQYYIREFNGTDRDIYLGLMQSKTQQNPDGTTGVKDHKGIFTDLLSLTVYDSDNKKVSAAVLQTWPSSVQVELFTIAQELCAVGSQTKAEEEAKNA
jgi:hypothetical protein